MATEQQIRDICGLYVAYFNRAADPAGLQFWIDQLDNGRDFATISQDFATSIEARGIFPFLADPDSVSSEAFITAIYANLFGRAPDADGLTFWVDVLESGAVAPGDMVEAIMLGAQDTTVVGGEVIRDLTTIENKIDAAKFWTDGASNIEGFVFDDAAYAAAQAAIAGIDDTAQSVEDAIEVSNLYLLSFEPTNTFTLWQNTVEISPATEAELVTETVIYWGFNPNSNDETGVDNTAEGNTNNLSNENIEDGGIPAELFFLGQPNTAGTQFTETVTVDGVVTTTTTTPAYIPGSSYLSIIAGLDFAELLPIDTDFDTFLPDGSFAGVRDITLTANAGDAGAGGTLSFLHADGSSDDIVLGETYFALLRDLILDEESNSRFFEKEVAVQVPLVLNPATGEYVVDPDAETTNAANIVGYVDLEIGGSDAVTAPLPVMLTPNVQNGSTVEPNARTTDANDTIVAGTLEVLHAAFIDGGEGYNKLEISAKGHFAQPKALYNIQEITISNLPNIYTTRLDGPDANDLPGDGDVINTFPDVQETSATGAALNSIVDLTTAIDLESVIITEGSFLGAVGQNTPGNLTVAGVGNGAEVTLDGAFLYGAVVVDFAETSGDGVDLVLNNANIRTGLGISQNSPTLNVESTGGGSFIDSLTVNAQQNTLGTGTFTDNVYQLNITGDARLVVEDNLGLGAANNTPVFIDASGNTAGVDLTMSGTEIVTFTGSQGNDRFAIETSNSMATGQGPDFDDDEAVTITNAVGDNYYDVSTYTLEVTDGDGDSNLEFVAVDTTVTMGDGDNFLQGGSSNFEATLGDGDNRIDINGLDSPQSQVFFNLPFAGLNDVDNKIDITVGDGANQINAFVGDTGTFTNLLGQTVSASGIIDVADINITAGDGGNIINIPALPLRTIPEVNGSDSGAINGVTLSDVDIITGSGDDINGVTLSDVDIITGSGDDTILVGGSDISVQSGGGADTITLLGIDNDFVTQVNDNKEFSPSNYGAVINIDTGSGSATINLGAFQDPAFGANGAIVASEGSVIEGNDITLFVNTTADLRAVDLNDISAIILDDDASAYTGQGFSRALGNNDIDASGAASLTLLDTQLEELLSDGTAFSTQGEFFGAQSVLTIVVTQDTVLSNLVNLSAWNDSVKFCFVVEDGVTLTLTAEELHNYVAPDGIIASFDSPGNGNYTGQVIITDAGPQFDPYNLAYNADNNNGGGGGSVGRDIDDQNVTTLFSPDGYERPTPPGRTDLIQIDSDDTPVVSETVYPFASDMTIEGNADLTLTGPIILDDDFNIDFSDFDGDFTDVTNGVPTITIANFQDITSEDSGNRPFDEWGSISGNGTSADPARVDFLLEWDGSTTVVGDSTFGVANGGFISSGVQQYVLTGFHTPVDFPNGNPRPNGGDILPQSGFYDATIVVCDKTEDLEVLGLQNNRNAFVRFEQVNWGTEILLEGDGYADASDQEKNLGDPDKSEVGYVEANFFEFGANAFVRLTNQGTELGLNEDAEDGFDDDGERILEAAGISVGNADRLLIQVEDGDAVINDVVGVGVERLSVTGPEDVEIKLAGIHNNDDDDSTTSVQEGFKAFDSDNLETIDGTGVAGEFTLTFEVRSFTDDNDTPGNPNDDFVVSFGQIVDLSEVDISGVDKINLDGDIILTMTADQVVALGAVIETLSGNTVLNVVEMADQAVDLSAVDVEDVGTVTFAEGDITVDATTDFGNADALVIPENSNVTMTVAQFKTADGGDDGQPNVIDEGDTITPTTPTTGETNADDVTEGMADEDDNSLTLTGVPEGEPEGSKLDPEIEVDLTDVSTHVDVILKVSDFTPTSNFDLVGNGGSVVLHVGGASDVSAADMGAITKYVLEDGATLTLTEEQLADALAAAQAINADADICDVIALKDGAQATLNITEIDGQYTDASDATVNAVFNLDKLVADFAGNLTIGTLSIADTNGSVGEPLDEVSGSASNDGFGEWTLGGAQQIILPTADENDPVDGIEPTTLFITQSQFLSLTGATTIDGNGTVNLIEVANNSDNNTNVLIDTSSIGAGITKGQLWLAEVGDDTDDPVNGTDATESGETVILNDASDVSGFDIRLTDGQRIGFANEGQAAATVFEDLETDGNPTGIIWTFTTFPAAPIDTSGYDALINTLFISEDLVDGQNEENLWTSLPGSIAVQKFNEEGVPDILLPFARVNTFEALSAIAGVTYDDQDEFETIGSLTLNLEGTTNIGDVLITDTVGDSAFDFLTINSYDDRSTLAPGSTFVTQPNVIGDITLDIGLLSNDRLGIFIDTDEFTDADIADGTDGAGTGTGNGATPAPREGVELQIGTIFLGDPGDFNFVEIDFDADADVTIAGIDMSDDDLELVFLDLFSGGTDNDFTAGTDITIGGVNYQTLATQMGIVTGADDIEHVFLLDNFTAQAPGTAADPADGVNVADDFNPTGGAPDTIINIVGGDNDLTALGTAAGSFDVDGVYASGPGTITLTAAQVLAITTDTDANNDGAADNWVLGPGVNPGDVTVNVTDLTTEEIDLDAIEAAGFNIGTVTIADTNAAVNIAAGTTFGGGEVVTPTADTTAPEFGTERTSVNMTVLQFLSTNGTISGDAEINLSGLFNNVDTDGDFVVDSADFDFSGINNAGTVTFADDTVNAVIDGNNPTDHFITLTDTADLGDFTIELGASDIIRFAEADQAAADVVVTLDGGNPVSPTGVQWLFTTLTAPVDTSGYDGAITTLFFDEALLVENPVEEELWTFLAGSIDVEKVNGSVIPSFISVNRTNTFEAFTNIVGGVNYDDANEFTTLGGLTMNLEGEVLLGDILIGDTNNLLDRNFFTTLTINSYEDLSNNPEFDPNVGIPGVIVAQNTLGDISLNAGALDELVDVVINTYGDDLAQTGAPEDDGFTDTENVNSAEVVRPGLAVETGVISFAANEAKPGTLTLTGAEDITIEGIDTSDAEISRVDVDLQGLDLASITTDGAVVTIAGQNIDELAVDMGLTAGDLDTYIILDDFTADENTDFNAGPGATGAPNIILETRGDVDLKEMDSAGGAFNVDGIIATEAGTISLTGAQLAAIMIVDGDNDGAADNFVLGPGLNPGDVTIDICDLDTTTAVNLDAIAAAGFNIGTITVTVDQELNAGTTLGDADQIVIELGATTDETISLEMTAEQFNGFSGIISESYVGPVGDPADYAGQVVVDELEAIEEGDTPTADIDLSQVTTTGANTIMLSANTLPDSNQDPAAPTPTNPDQTGNDAADLAPSTTPVTDGNHDVALADTANLGNFQIVLNDLDNEGADAQSAGQTIRLSTFEQANGRIITVFDAEGGSDKDVNVVWMFNEIPNSVNPGPGGLDVRGYDADIGRIFVTEALLNSANVLGNIDGLFTIDNPEDPGNTIFTLDAAIIKRTISDPTDPLGVAIAVNQAIEVEAFGSLDQLLAEIIDPVIFIEQLTIDFGGQTTTGDIEVDNLLGVDILGDDDFELLTLNSYIADFFNSQFPQSEHYLTPINFDPNTDVLPTREIQFDNAPNVVGDIRAGTDAGDRGVLRNVEINTGEGDWQLAVTAAAADNGQTVDVQYEINDVDNVQLSTATINVVLSDPTNANAVAADIAAALDAVAGIEAEALGSNVVLNAAITADEVGDVRGDFGRVVEILSVTLGGGAAAGLVVDDSAGGERGTDFVAQTIFFSEDDDPISAIGTLDIDGVNDVTIKGHDTTDAEIVVASVDTSDHLGNFTVTGGSAAFTGGATTEKLIISNGGSDTGVVNYGGTLGDNPATQFTDETDFFIPTEVGGQVQAGIDGEALSSINTSDHGGTVNLGTISRIDGTGLNSATTAGFDPLDTFDGGFNDGFILNNGGNGTVILCLGEAENTDGSITFPVLEAGGEWTFTGPGVELEMKQVTVNAGGILNLNSVSVTISEDIDLTPLGTGLTASGTTSFEVLEGDTLILTVEQVTALAAVEFFGAGTIEVTGESDSTAGSGSDTTFDNLRTATVDLSGVDLAATDDGVLQIIASGAESDATGTALVDDDGNFIAQTIIGSDNNDELTIAVSALRNEGGAGTPASPLEIDVVARLGADDGDIGVEEQTPTTNTPDDLTPEVAGDVILAGGSAASVFVDVDAGFDRFDGLGTGDVVQVNDGAEFYSNNVENFVASNTTDNVIDVNLVGTTDDVSSILSSVAPTGEAVLEASGDQDIDLDGASGDFIIIGAADSTSATNMLTGGLGDDTLIDGAADDTMAFSQDVFTGGDGADTFVFNLAKDELVDIQVNTVQSGVDVETITFTAAAAEGDLPFDAVVTIGAATFNIPLDPAVDGTDANALAAAIETALTPVAGVTAIVNAAQLNELTLIGADELGISFALEDSLGNDVTNTYTGGGAGIDARTDLGASADDDGFANDPLDNNDDRAQKQIVIDTSEIPGDGDYLVTIDQGDLTGPVTAVVSFVGSGSMVPGAVSQELADAIKVAINGPDFSGVTAFSGGDALPVGNASLQQAATATAPGTVTVISDDPNAGGLETITIGFNATVEAVSSSNGVSTAAATDVDIITDFVRVDDSIDFSDDDLPAGTSTNYAESDNGGAGFANAAAALVAANASLTNEDDLYFLAELTPANPGDDPNSLLFYDANGDGTADGYVQLNAVGIADFDFDDII